MTRLFPRLFLLAGFCATAALTQEKYSDSRLFISNVNVINPETGKEVPHRTVIVSGERIAEVKGVQRHGNVRSRCFAVWAEKQFCQTQRNV